MTYALLAFGLLGLIGWGVWMYRKGKRSAEADAMEDVLDDVAVARKAREAIEAKHIDVVRADLARRMRKRAF